MVTFGTPERFIDETTYLVYCTSNMTEFSYQPPVIEHVKQPDGSELCLMACIASATGRTSDEYQAAIHTGLMAAYVSEENGESTPVFEATPVTITLDGGHTEGLELETIYGLDDLSTEGAMHTIADALSRGERLALLHKKTSNPEEPGMHWVLLASHQLMDPLADETTPLDQTVVQEMVARSVAANGVFVVAIR